MEHYRFSYIIYRCVLRLQIFEDFSQTCVTDWTACETTIRRPRAHNWHFNKSLGSTKDYLKRSSQYDFSNWKKTIQKKKQLKHRNFLFYWRNWCQMTTLSWYIEIFIGIINMPKVWCGRLCEISKIQKRYQFL